VWSNVYHAEAWGVCSEDAHGFPEKPLLCFILLGRRL
jgi:hypothetical protein